MTFLSLFCPGTCLLNHPFSKNGKRGGMSNRMPHWWYRGRAVKNNKFNIVGDPIYKANLPANRMLRWKTGRIPRFQYTLSNT
jgi:hypothetical protein